MFGWPADLFVLIVLLLLLFKYTRLTAPFLPTKSHDLDRIATALTKYQINSFVDLGAGSGRVLAYLNQRSPNKKFIGVEIAPLLWLFNQFRFGLNKNVRVKPGSLFWHDYADYDGLFLFWTPKTIAKNQAKLMGKLYAGQIVISYAFPIKFLDDQLLEYSHPDKHLPLYIYKIKNS